MNFERDLLLTHMLNDDYNPLVIPENRNTFSFVQYVLINELIDCGDETCKLVGYDRA